MKKAIQVLVAAAAGASLVVGGSYALWKDTASSSTESVIQTGSSELTQIDAGAWSTVRTGVPLAIPDINDYRIVPGDSVTFTQKFLLKTEGGSAATRVAFDFENDAAVGVKALRDRGIDITTTVTDDGTEQWLAGTSAMSDTLNVAFVQTGPTAAAGMTLKLQVGVTFDHQATADDLKLLTAVIGDAAVTAGQTS